MPLVPTESASRLIPPNIRNTPPLPKAVIAFTENPLASRLANRAFRPSQPPFSSGPKAPVVRMPPLPPPDIPRSASTRPPHAANRAVPHLRPARAVRPPPPIRIRCKRLRAVVLRQFVMHPHAIERRCIIRHFDRTFRRSLFDHRQIAFNIHRRSIAESPAGLLRSPPRKSGRPSARTEHSENEPSIHAVALSLADECQRQRVRGNRLPDVQTHDLLADFPIRRMYRTKQRIELRTLRP